MKINLRKIGTAALACILSLSSAAAAVSVYNGSGDIFSKVSAAQQGHITINAHTGDNGKVQSLAGKKFNVYKVFDALNSDGMESINYTINPLYVQALKNATKKDSEYAIIDYIQSMNNNLVTNDVNHNQKNETVYSDFRYFVESLRNEIVRLGNKPTQIVTVPEGTEESYTLDVDYGWYLIDEVTNVEGTHSAASLCMVNTANPDMTVDIKSDFPVIQKQIQEDDNRKNIGINSDGWNDVADFEIGQTVPYRYNSYVPDMNGYDTYYYAVHDKMNSALTFVPDSVKVKIGSMTLQKDTDYRVVTEGIDDGETFQIQIMDLKAVINRYYYSGEAGNKPETEKVYGQKILIEYDAVLNEDAQLDTGRPGFENDVKLEYSNNPDADGAGQTGETPWDTVVCFTFRMDGIKVNDQVPERKLEGAKFKLYSDKDCTQEVYVKKASKSDGYTVISRDSVAGSASPSEAVEIVSDENGAFNIIGLDSQVYFLKETKAPDGYRLLKDPIEIDVKAVYGADNRTEYIKGDGATDKTLRSLEATAKFKEFYTGVHSEYEKSLSTNVDTGTLNIKVVNKVGSKLPATGSAATIVLVCAGTAVMAAVLIKKKKNEKEYIAQTEEWKKKTKEYYKEFPAMVKARDQILYASDMEKRYDSLRITKVSMEAGELVAENQEAGLSIYGVPEILEFTVSYSQLKDWLHRIPKEEERKSINEMVLTLDEASGNLVGDIRMKQYYMLGTGEEYQPAEINDVQKGTDNIFGGASGIAPEDVQQTKASQQAGEKQETETPEQ